VKKLSGKTVLVTGASRGIGKGIAVALADAGATVYVTGRTVEQGGGIDNLPGTMLRTKEEIEQRGGECIAVHCDHTKDKDVKAVFEQIKKAQGRLDILVNNVWGGYETMFNERGEYVWERPFWEQRPSLWDSMFAAGVRAYWVSSCFAARIMVTQKSGLIANISYWAGQKYMGNVCYGVSKTATDRLTSDTSHELRPHNVAVVSLYPGLVRTERVMRAAGHFNLDNSESPQFTGKVIYALTLDPKIMEKSGKVLIVAQLAIEYGISDIDGNQPRPLTLDEV
jgi:NAD(P)-dependent dehydrogenase (short-subunit alcohol dehydrogenase family)